MSWEVVLSLIVVGLLAAYAIGNFVAEELEAVFDPSIDDEVEEGDTWNTEQ